MDQTRKDNQLDSVKSVGKFKGNIRKGNKVNTKATVVDQKPKTIVQKHRKFKGKTAVEKEDSDVERMHSDDDIQQVGRPNKDGEFREKVLCLLKKRPDEVEYRSYRHAVRDGSYHVHYPDLRKKLLEYRYKRRKCLNILRGFFFWLQNVPHEGVFKPWKDRECLAVEPASL